MPLTPIALAAGTPYVIDATELRREYTQAHVSHSDNVILHVLAINGSIAVTGRLHDAPVADSAGAQLAYEAMGPGEVVAGGTAITAPGLYRIPADNCDVILTLTGTSASIVYSGTIGA